MPNPPNKAAVILSPRTLRAKDLSSIAALPRLPLTSSFRARLSRGICFSLLCCLAIFVACNCILPVAFAPPKRPAILGVAFVRISVSSVEGAKKFYGDALGLPLINQCFSESAAQCFFIKPLQELQVAQLDHRPGERLVAAIGILTSDAGTLREYLIANGAHPGKLESPHDGAPFFEISDPEGRQLVFISTHGVAGSVLGGDRQVSVHLIHAGFIVRDRAATEHFYKDILGFRPYWHGGMKNNETDWISLQVPDGTDWVELMVNVDKNPDQALRGIMNHIALGVPDIHAAQQQLLKNGMKLTEEPKIGRDGKWQLNLYDPDMTRIELMEFTPVEKPCCSDYTGPHPKP